MSYPVCEGTKTVSSFGGVVGPCPFCRPVTIPTIEGTHKMTLTERTEHEIKHLCMVSPETARALLADNARLREAIEKHRKNVYAEDAHDASYWKHDDHELYDALKEATVG